MSGETNSSFFSDHRPVVCSESSSTVANGKFECDFSLSGHVKKSSTEHIDERHVEKKVRDIIAPALMFILIIKLFVGLTVWCDMRLWCRGGRLGEGEKYIKKLNDPSSESFSEHSWVSEVELSRWSSKNYLKKKRVEMMWGIVWVLKLKSRYVWIYYFWAIAAVFSLFLQVLISESCSEHSICSVEEIMMRMIKRPR